MGQTVSLSSSTVALKPKSQVPAGTEPPGATPINGVTVRTLQKTQSDIEFATEIVMEAFRGKFIHNVTVAK